MRLEHANITVSNIEQSYDFYHAVFGFERRWEGMASGEEGPVRAMHVGNDHTYISLFEAEIDVKPELNYGKTGFNHLGFEVKGLETYRKRLEALEVEIHLVADYEPGKRLYFMDPNGVEIELVEY